MNVEVRHLKALLALVESDTFTTAAAVMGTTQPTLSRTIGQLEDAVGVKLVYRSTREMRFTEAGLSLAQSARSILTSLDKAVSSIQENNQPPPLRLGWAWAGFGRHAVPLLRHWRQDHGDLIEFSRPEDPLQALCDGKIDVALVRSTNSTKPSIAGMHTTSLFHERLMAGISSTDPRAQLTSVMLSELAESTIAVCATAPTATAGLWHGEVAVPPTITVANTDEWLSRIAIGDAVGLTAEATTHNHQTPEVIYVPVEDAPEVSVDLMFLASTPHPQAGSFTVFARSYFLNLISSSTPPSLLSAGDGH